MQNSLLFITIETALKNQGSYLPPLSNTIRGDNATSHCLAFNPLLRKGSVSTQRSVQCTGLSGHDPELTL